jgi:hypothetical protein
MSIVLVTKLTVVVLFKVLLSLAEPMFHCRLPNKQLRDLILSQVNPIHKHIPSTFLLVIVFNITFTHLCLAHIFCSENGSLFCGSTITKVNDAL